MSGRRVASLKGYVRVAPDFDLDLPVERLGVAAAGTRLWKLLGLCRPERSMIGTPRCVPRNERVWFSEGLEMALDQERIDSPFKPYGAPLSERDRNRMFDISP